MSRTMTFCRTIAFFFVISVGLDSTYVVAQRRLPSPRRLSDSGSDVFDLERETTADDVPLKSVPSELEQDRMRSLALFGQARLLYQRGEAAKALRTYQRAHHWNPDSGQAAAEVIPLAFYLDRPGEATRYALLAAEKGKPDTQLMRTVAVHLVQDEEYERADRLYQIILKKMETAPRDYEWIGAHFESGRLFFLQENFVAAADSFSIVVDGLDNPDEFGIDKEVSDQILGKPSLTYGLFGEAFLEADRLERAERMFRKSEEIVSNKPLFAYHTARLAAKRNQNELALQKLNQYLESNSSDAGTEPYDWLKKLIPNTDKWLARLEILQKSQSNTALTDYLAEYFEKNDQPKRALALYQQLDSEQGTGYSKQAVIRMASKTKNTQAFLKTLGQVISKTGNIDALEFDELVINTPTKPTEFLRRVFDVATRTLIPPKTTLAREQLFGVGLLAIKVKDLKLGHELIDAAIESADAKSRADWQFSSGLEMFMVDDLDGAVAQFRALQKSGNAPDPSTVDFYLATTLELDGKNREANRVIDRAIARTPDSPLLKTRKAWIAYHNDENEKAIEYYSEFLEEYGDSYANEAIRDLVKEAKSSLSNLRLLAKDVDGAIESLQEVLDEYPEDVGAMNDLGYLLADENRHLNRALRMAKFAVKNEPENNAYLDSLGWALYRLGRYDEAANYLTRAASVDEPDGIILEHLGDVHDKMKRPDQAKNAWERALKAFDDSKETERVTIVEKKIATLKKN